MSFKDFQPVPVQGPPTASDINRLQGNLTNTFNSLKTQQSTTLTNINLTAGKTNTVAHTINHTPTKVNPMLLTNPAMIWHIKPPDSLFLYLGTTSNVSCSIEVL